MGFLDLSFAVKQNSTETVTVTRYERDAYDVHGVAYPRMAAGSYTPRCAVQPATGSELKLLPEGLRSSNTKSIWSPITLAEGDLITITEGVFKVFKVLDWASNGSYCKAIMIELAEGEGS